MSDSTNYISILSDYGFKLTFADESDTTFLRRALQALLQSDYAIEKVKFLTNEFIGLTQKARGGVYDLICEDEKGSTFIVEMQLGFYKHYIHRAKFYAFHRFNTLVEKGDYRFDNLTPIYCIGFLAKSIYPDSQQYYHYATLKNQVGEDLDTQIVHIIVEIDKFDKPIETITTDLDKLIFLMKNEEYVQQINELPPVLSEDWIQIAMRKLDKGKMTPEQRMHFEMMLARNASILQMEEEEKRQREEAFEEEKRQIAEAAEKRKEKQVLTETAKRMRSIGMTIDEVTKVTGLTTEEIEALPKD